MDEVRRGYITITKHALEDFWLKNKDFVPLNVTYDNGEYKIFARATDGKSYSPLSQITLIVSNPILKEETKDTESTPGFELILIILSLIVLLISYQKTRKNNKR